MDRAGTSWVVFDIDGTPEAARQRSLYLWPIGHRSRAHRCGRVRRSSPWERVQRARPPACASASAPASRSVPTAPGKPDGPQSLRLPTNPGGTGGHALPRGRGHASEPRKKKSPVGVTRAGVVYELFWTSLPQHAFTACDVVELYLHRGASAPILSDEDSEQDPARWCSHSAWGQECWQVVSPWTWNLRLELGHQLKPQPMRTTEFAPALADGPEPGAKQAPVQGYGVPAVALRRTRRALLWARLSPPA